MICWMTSIVTTARLEVQIDKTRYCHTGAVLIWHMTLSGGVPDQRGKAPRAVGVERPRGQVFMHTARRIMIRILNLSFLN